MRGREPGRKQPDGRERRVHPIPEDMFCRRQGLHFSKAVDLGREKRIHDESVEGVEQNPLERARHPGRHKRKIMSASERGRLKVYGDEREAIFFVSDVRAEDLSLRDKKRLNRIEFLDSVIGRLYDRQNDAFGEDLETRFRLPKFWVFDDREIILRRPKTDEFQARVQSVVLEILAGAKDHAMTALA